MTTAGRLPDPGTGFAWERHRNGVEAFPVLRARHGDVTAIFTTRVGGVCAPPVDSLNISFRAQREHGRQPFGRWRVEANRSIASRALGVDRGWEPIRQVHSADVVEAGSGSDPEADAVWTDEADRTLAVGSADCVLLSLVGPKGFAVAHAGWRGLLAGVVEAAAGAVDARVAHLGPAIGPCCFEVGREVVEPFRARFSDEVVADERHVDLWSAAQAAAKDAGVADVHVCRICTSCHPDLFFSHRRDGGRTGRQALVATIEGAGGG